MLGGVTAAEAKSSKSAKYDLVIVGAGCGGLVCAIHAAELGLKPLLLEKMPMPAGMPSMPLASCSVLTRASRKPRMSRPIRPKRSMTT